MLLTELLRVWRELFVIAQSQERLYPRGEKTPCVALLSFPLSLSLLFSFPTSVAHRERKQEIREQSR